MMRVPWYAFVCIVALMLAACLILFLLTVPI